MNLGDRLGILRGIQAVVVSGAALTTMIVGYFTVAALTGLPPFGDESPSSGTPSSGTNGVATLPPEDTLGKEPGPPTLAPGEDPDFRLTKVDCAWSPPTDSSPAQLHLTLRIATDRQATGAIPVEVRDGREPLENSIQLEDWDAENGEWVIYSGVDVDLDSEDLGQRHEFTIELNSGDFFPESDKSNNTTNVRIDIPTTLPTEIYQELPRCTSPIP